MEDPSGDATAQPTLPTRRSDGDGHGDGTPRAGAGPVMKEHAHRPDAPGRGGQALSPGLSSSGFLQRWKFTSDERESDPASPRKENRERSEEKTAQKKCIEGSSFLTPPCQPLETTTLTGLLQSQRITL